MIIDNLTGYMLGNSTHIVCHGEQWCSIDMPVCICQTLERAQQILNKSNINAGRYNKPVWTTIYRVHANNLPCVRIVNGLIYTNAATCIFVEGPVAYRGNSIAHGKASLYPARKLRPGVLKLINPGRGGK